MYSAPDSDLAARPRFNLAADRDAVGVFILMDDGEERGLPECTE